MCISLFCTGGLKIIDAPPLLGPASTAAAAAMNVDMRRNAVISFTFLLYTDGSPFKYKQTGSTPPPERREHHATSIARRTI